MSDHRDPYPPLTFDLLLQYVREEFEFSSDQDLDTTLVYGLLWLHHVPADLYNTLKDQARYALIKQYLRWIGTICISSIFLLRGLFLMVMQGFDREFNIPMLCLSTAYLFILIRLVTGLIEYRMDPYWDIFEDSWYIKSDELITIERLSKALSGLNQTLAYREAIRFIHGIYENISEDSDHITDASILFLTIGAPRLYKLGNLIRAEMVILQIEKVDLYDRAAYKKSVIINAIKGHQFSKN